MAIIKDGQTGNTAGVNSGNRLLTKSISESEASHATEGGRGVNLNTGDITVTSDSALMYFKNTNELDFIVDAVAVGVAGNAIHSGGSPYIEIVRDIDGGDIITDATPIEMDANRNLGFTDSIGNTFKGKDGGTATNGVRLARLLLSSKGRGYFTVGFVLPKQSTVTIKLEANIGYGSMTIYTAIIGHYVEED